MNTFPVHIDHLGVLAFLNKVVLKLGYRLAYSLFLVFFTVLTALPILAIAHQLQTGSFGNMFNFIIQIIYFPLTVWREGVIMPSDILLAATIWIGLFSVMTYMHDRYASPQRPWTESIMQTVHGPYIFAYVSLCCAIPYLPGSESTNLRTAYIWIATFFLMGYAAYWMARLLQWGRLEIERAD